MKNEELYSQLKKKLKLNGKDKDSLKWFWQNYLPNMRYSTVCNQLNGFSELSEDVKKIGLNYLNN